MNILIADQDHKHRQHLMDVATDSEFSITESINARNILQILQQGHQNYPDLILVDLDIGGTSAVDLVKQIRNLGGTAVWNPIFVMGDKITQRDKEELLEAGVDGYLIKPIKKIDLKFRLAIAKRHFELRDDVFTIAHELVLANHALESASYGDTLTGLMDLNSFYTAIEKEWMLAKNESKTLSLAIVDLDYFHKFNELYTPEVGDQTIKRISNSLRNIPLQKGYKLARTTGITFGLLMPDTKTKEAEQMAQKFLNTISSLKIPHAGSRCSSYVTASVGVSSTDIDNLKNPLDLMEAADFALYQAKHKGRNRVYFELAKVY